MKFILPLGLALLVPVTAEAASKCFTPRFVSLVGQTVNAQMIAESGRSCGIGLVSSDGPVKSTWISTQARNGTATATGTRVSYKSRPGFTGRDSFTYSRTLIDRYGKPGTKIVVVTIEVVH